MKITAEEIKGKWWVTYNGKPKKEFGPGKINMLKAIDYAAKARAPQKFIEVQTNVNEVIDWLKNKIPR